MRCYSGSVSDALFGRGFRSRSITSRPLDDRLLSPQVPTQTRAAQVDYDSDIISLATSQGGRCLFRKRTNSICAGDLTPRRFRVAGAS